MAAWEYVVPFASASALILIIWALALLFSLAVLVMGILVVMATYKAERVGWWVYLIAMFVGPLNIAAIIAWYAYLRDNPVLDSQGRPFL